MSAKRRTGEVRVVRGDEVRVAEVNEGRPTVQSAIRSTVGPGARLFTPTGRGQFTVAEIDDVGVVLLLGKKEAHTRLSWSALEGVPTFLRGRGWVLIGSIYDVSAIDGTLDAYLKLFVNRATAGWVAVLLEQAGIVQLNRERPAAAVRLR